MPQKEELRKFIHENFLYGESSMVLHDDTSFLETGIIDSTGVLELISFVQKKYGISVNDEELLPENFDSIARLATYIEKKKTLDSMSRQ